VTEIPELSVEQVAARLDQPDFFVYDNNGHGRWARGHVPNAKNLNPYDFERSELPEDLGATLVFYCSGPG
jgi:hypothetical protein